MKVKDRFFSYDLEESRNEAAASRQIEYDMASESVIVCPYCWNEKGNRLSCCGEVHFVEVSRKAWGNGEEL